MITGLHINKLDLFVWNIFEYNFFSFIYFINEVHKTKMYFRTCDVVTNKTIKKHYFICCSAWGTWKFLMFCMILLYLFYFLMDFLQTLWVMRYIIGVGIVCRNKQKMFWSSQDCTHVLFSSEKHYKHLVIVLQRSLS